MPLRLAGLRLATTTTKRCCISGSGMCFTSPETTTRGAASPQRMSSTYKESASGCFFAVVMRPTRRSTRDTSTAFCAADFGLEPQLLSCKTVAILETHVLLAVLPISIVAHIFPCMGLLYRCIDREFRYCLEWSAGVKCYDCEQPCVIQLRITSSP